MRDSTIILLALVTFGGIVSAQDVQKLSATCVACHGENGVSSNDLWPNLAGQKKDYLTKQLTAFQSGERKDPLMSPMASSLSKSDIEVLATHFSQLKASP